jgi:DNA-binding response OmpR family regulator
VIPASADPASSKRESEEEQFCMQLCGKGKAALQKSEAGNFDRALPDGMLPDPNEFDVVAE